MRTYAWGGMKLYGVQQGGEGGQNLLFFAYVIYGWPPRQNTQMMELRKSTIICAVFWLQV